MLAGWWKAEWTGTVEPLVDGDTKGLVSNQKSGKDGSGLHG